MWRPRNGERRIKIGIISVSKEGAFSFTYDSEGVAKAKAQDPNFNGYPGLPVNDGSYSDSNFLKSIFFRRLINLERADRDDLLSFWLLNDENASDGIMLLAFTQGMNMSDMFEFVPQFYSSHKIPFITDIAALSKTNFDLSLLKTGEKLKFVHDVNNPVDKFAIKVFKGTELIGYIKHGHNQVFAKKSSQNITLTVHKIVNIPPYKKLYVRVSF
jgi:hypothetical protein